MDPKTEPSRYVVCGAAAAGDCAGVRSFVRVAMLGPGSKGHPCDCVSSRIYVKHVIHVTIEY